MQLRQRFEAPAHEPMQRSAPHRDSGKCRRSHRHRISPRHVDFPPATRIVAAIDRLAETPSISARPCRVISEGCDGFASATIASCTKSGTMNASCWSFVSPTGGTPIGGHLDDLRPETCIRVCLSTDRLSSSSAISIAAVTDVEYQTVHAAHFWGVDHTFWTQIAGNPENPDHRAEMRAHSPPPNSPWTPRPLQARRSSRCSAFLPSSRPSILRCV